MEQAQDIVDCRNNRDDGCTSIRSVTRKAKAAEGNPFIVCRGRSRTIGPKMVEMSPKRVTGDKTIFIIRAPEKILASFGDDKIIIELF